MRFFGIMTILTTLTATGAGAGPLASAAEERFTRSLVTRWAQVPGGTIAYDDTEGAGPVVICVPGMGDFRASYRFLAPRLAAAGYRVITMDVRGHGESSVDWKEWGPLDVGADVLALMDALGVHRAHLVGNSFAAGSVYAASVMAPDRVASVTVLGPAMTQGKPNRLLNLVLRIGLARPWGPGFWLGYWDTLLPVHRPDDFAAYRAALGASLREPGRLEALTAMAFASHAPVEGMLGRSKAPMLLIMGSRDRDFPDPAAEAARVGTATGAEVHVLEAGHYPHVERPDDVADLVVPFLGAH